MGNGLPENYENYRLLAAAIIHRAAYDYVETSKRINDATARGRKPSYNTVRLNKECERFFLSQEYEMLNYTDISGEELLWRLGEVVHKQKRVNTPELSSGNKKGSRKKQVV